MPHTNKQVEEVIEEFRELKQRAKDKLKALAVHNGSAVDAEVITEDWLKQSLLTLYEQGRKDERERVIKGIEKILPRSDEDSAFDAGFRTAIKQIKIIIGLSTPKDTGE